MNADYERGFVAGWNAARNSVEDLMDISESSEFREPMQVKATAPKRKRKPSAYSKRYGQRFKGIAHKYKLKNGSWAKNGFMRAQKEAHRLAKK